MSRSPDTLLPFMVEALADKPHLDLTHIQEPWMYLRSQGFTHEQIREHVDAAIRQVQERRAAVKALQECVA